MTRLTSKEDATFLELLQMEYSAEYSAIIAFSFNLARAAGKSMEVAMAMGRESVVDVDWDQERSFEQVYQKLLRLHF